MKQKMKMNVRTLDAPWQISQENHEVENAAEPKGVEFWAKSDDLCRLLENARVVSIWNMKASLGDTLADKMQDFLLHINEITQFLIENGAAGYFWMAGNSKMTKLFKLLEFNPSRHIGNFLFENQALLGIDSVYDEGTILGTWRLFMCPELPDNRILIGVNNSEEDVSHYASVTLAMDGL